MVSSFKFTEPVMPPLSERLKEMQADDIYLDYRPNIKNSIIMDAPDNADIKVEKTGNSYWYQSMVTVNNNTYKVTADEKSLAPCHLEFTQCRYESEEEEFALKPPSSAGYLIKWRNEEGVFFITLRDIYINSDFSLEGIAITKDKPSIIFSEKEVEMWKKLLTTIRIK